MRNFLDNINLPGGHILLLILIGILAACAHKWGIPKMDEVAHDSFVALLAVLSSRGLTTLTSPSQPITLGLQTPNAS